ncbi:MAG: hypothetical protein IKB50_00700 [Clostridia bacterium]|nr:hypothetical protein [Clostridia bacterium]
MSKKIYFFIDDNIWAFRQLAERKPESIFDVPFFGMLKGAHDNYGLKVQLNLFYQTDESYGEGTFTLAEVPDTYKSEWEANSDWLKLAYHAKKEFPNFPHLNIDYDDMYNTFKNIEREVFRFAGEKSFTYVTCAHWVPVSKDGVQALYDCGVPLLYASYGDPFEYDPETSDLTPDCVELLLDNRKPESKCYKKFINRDYYLTSLCSYNNISSEDEKRIYGTFDYITDEETGMKFKCYSTGICLNSSTLESLPERFEKQKDQEYVCIFTHEQYYHDFYVNYQPDTAEKYNLMAKYFTEHGFEFFFLDEIL